MNGSASEMLLNTATYTTLQLALFMLGSVSWAVVYAVVIRNIRRQGVVEIPTAAVASNLAWVTVWGFLHRTDMGALVVWMNRGAIVLELAVFLYVLMRGARHVRTPEVRQWFKPGLIASYVCWAVMLHLFVVQKYDSPNGILSGFMVALFMSAMYVLVELENIDVAQYSLTVASGKLFGNACAAVFSVLVYPGNHLLLSLCAVTFILDVIYLALFQARRSARQRVRAPV